MIYVLVLSRMTAANYEYSHVVAAWADSREPLERLLEDEKVETYTEDAGPHHQPWMKNFRKDGPLEWFNPPMEGDDPIKESESPEEFAARISVEALRQRREQMANTFKAV